MPGMTGLQLWEALGTEQQFSVIFVSAHHQFAINAFKVSAVDYLLKPFDKDDLAKALEKVKKSRQRDQGNETILNFLRNSYADPASRKLAVPNRDGYTFISVKDIVYCKADGAYTHLILNKGERILLSNPLGETESLLPAELFERVHHSYIINMQNIYQLIKSDGNYLVMDNMDEIPVSKSRRDSFMERVGLIRRT